MQCGAAFKAKSVTVTGYLFGLRTNAVYVTNVGKLQKQSDGLYSTLNWGLRCWMLSDTQPVECRSLELVIQIFWWYFPQICESLRHRICDTNTFLSHLSVNSFIHDWGRTLTCIDTLHYVQPDPKLMGQKCPWKLKDACEIANAEPKNRPLLNWSTLSAFHPVNM